MFLHQVGDKVKLSKSSQGILSKAVFTALCDEVFTISSIRTDNSCEENNPNCTCDKYVTLKSHNIVLQDMVSDEFTIVSLK